ncbi:Hypothetical protein NGAL_HAMBI1145_36640 [Neorhizobium galegae bv. officinalis]|uniref:Uncharacterized protein n=1 Tax=Neorhizobium galegae bv. officinalis TaxID=323656 RepID=A0A0T7G6E1_NEOGA|nr:Hypothetical protein NGAL_HAMBI490_26020 [Neorhizobium galegae bv. officinalis]CDZ37055.1 Hypothetical protein NGAL_HAMBI1145_36640 [Neorhizobium galegae bv. officinalis]CDZ42890.1 Hypothetical protein NGAL_HAMBI1146_56630 [Neorhizobium galegae bv. officinalis]CDZ50905.1 Hypothetical protein NGAL_HAMBI1189_36890 [Neorhizobium galegae bv. officinalis]
MTVRDIWNHWTSKASGGISGSANSIVILFAKPTEHP